MGASLRRTFDRRRRAAAALVLGLSAISPTAIAQTFVPPPRSIADVTAVLDSDKPDPTKLGRYAAQADAQPPAGASGSTLAKFYRDRAVAASQVGRAEQWIAEQRAMWEARTDRMSAFVERLHQEDLSNDKRDHRQR